MGWNGAGNHSLINDFIRWITGPLALKLCNLLHKRWRSLYELDDHLVSLFSNMLYTPVLNSNDSFTLNDILILVVPLSFISKCTDEMEAGNGSRKWGNQSQTGIASMSTVPHQWWRVTTSSNTNLTTFFSSVTAALQVPTYCHFSKQPLTSYFQSNSVGWYNTTSHVFKVLFNCVGSLITELTEVNQTHSPKQSSLSHTVFCKISII